MEVGFSRDVGQEGLGLISDGRTVFAVIGHLVPDELDVHVQSVRQRQRVEGRHFTRCDDDIVSDFVSDDYLSVAVIDYPSGRVDGLVHHGVVVRADLVFVMDDLDGKQFGQENGYCHPQAYQQLVFPVDLHNSIFWNP